MDLVKSIFQNSITQQSQWNTLSESCHDNIRSVLSQKGFINVDGHKFVKDRTRIFLDLVDDVTSLVSLNDLTTNDILITDTQISRPINARVFNVPRSWMGVFGHRPEYYQFDSLKDYSLLTNRIDPNRMRIMMCLDRYKHLHDGIINFNCVMPDNWTQHCDEIAVQNWDTNWSEMSDILQAKYSREYGRLRAKMPLRNHDWSHDQALQASQFNMVIETFHGDESVRFSEKTFAAIVLPRPWAIFAGRWATVCLRRWGFDTLDDLVAHEFDCRTHIDFKHETYVENCVHSMQPIDHHLQRLEQAATHNQNLLLGWREHWEKDFQNWLDFVDQSIID
jgi:hypothetical protein